MEAQEEVAAVRLAGLAGLGMIDSVQPLEGDRWLVDHRLNRPEVWEEPTERELLVLDQALQPVWRLRPPPEPSFWRAGHAVADDLSLVALALPHEVRLVNADGELISCFAYPAEQDSGYTAFSPQGDYLMVRFPGRYELLTLDPEGQVLGRSPHHVLGEAGGCAFSADGHWLWTCVPHMRAGPGVEHELWLIELASRQVVDRRPLHFYGQLVVLTRHPDGQTIRVSLGYGSESADYWARAAGRRIQLHGPLGPGRLEAFHPTGSECLATRAAEEEPEELTRRRWPDGAVLARLPMAAVGPPECCWTAAAYVTEELLVATVRWPAEERERHLLLAHDRLRPLGWIRYPDSQLPPGWIGPGRNGSWLTLHYFKGDIDQWTLAQPPNLTPNNPDH